VLPGLIQKARLDAERLKFRVTDSPKGWHLWLADPDENDEWRYIGRFTRRKDITVLLTAYLPAAEVEPVIAGGPT